MMASPSIPLTAVKSISWIPDDSGLRWLDRSFVIFQLDLSLQSCSTGANMHQLFTLRCSTTSPPTATVGRRRDVAVLGPAEPQLGTQLLRFLATAEGRLKGSLRWPTHRPLKCLVETGENEWQVAWDAGVASSHPLPNSLGPNSSSASASRLLHGLQAFAPRWITLRTTGVTCASLALLA